MICSLRAAIEWEAFEGRSGLFRFGTAPLGGPLRLRYEHPVLAVLLLPHLSLSALNGTSESYAVTKFALI